ncbi:sigma-70 family RNA polymerase sigma factor [Enteractinococcus helveticum]|uniref:sigma-70 family RNA polymerase sigma factor n=1 Tax=Enteractinococcus helveticum TaxID=1837282 RepID=UPI000AF4665E
MARNLFIDRARSAGRHQEVPSAQMDEEMDLSADRVEQLFDQMLLTDALDSLADHHRDVVIRAFYGGLSTAQLATELGIPEGTVKSRLHYGLRALRLALQERGVTR